MTAARLLPAAAAAASALLCGALFYYGTTPGPYWSPDFASDTFYHVVLGAALAAALHYWNRDKAAPVLAAAVGLYLAGGVGFLPALSVLLIACASLLLGRRLLNWMFPRQACSATPALICGLAVYLNGFGLMLHFPVNYPAVYLLLLCAPLLAEHANGGLAPLRQQFFASVAQWRSAADQVPYWLFAAALVGGLLVARIAFLPSLGFDDNTLHLRLWAQLRYEHEFGFDYISHVWEVAPFLVDLLHASASLVAGAEARGATNLLLLGILLRQMWVVLGALQLGAAQRILALALFLSTPTLGDLLLTQQTELFLAVMTMTALRLTLELRGAWCGPHVAALLAIAALCCAAKLPGAVLGLALLAPAAVRLWAQRGAAEPAASRSVTLLGAFVASLAVLAFHPYVNAWLQTGNPFFPLYNGFFMSPFFEPYNFVDARWLKGFSLASYWDLFFNTSGYSESRNGVAGFQYLLLLPLGAAALLALRTLRPLLLPVLLPLAGFGLVVFAAIQYWRYLFPVLPLAAVVIAALLVPQYSRPGKWLVHGALLICIAANALFYPGVSSLLGQAPGRLWTAAAKQRALEFLVPARMLTEWVNTNAPGSTVLYPEAIPFGAMLHGTPVYVNWYSPANSTAYYAIRNEADGMAFLRERNIDFAIGYMNDPGLPGTRAWALRTFLANVGRPLRQAGDHILYRFDGDSLTYRPLFEFGETLALDATPRLIGSVTTGAATAARYSAEFACTEEAGYFIAQINWNNGEFYYHRVNCGTSTSRFVEGLPVPPGATAGDVYAYVTDTDAATLTRLSLEILE